MNHYSIDGSLFLDRNSAYDAISSALNLPDWFGRNLDALFDVLSTTRGEITVENTAALLNNLGSYGCSLIKTFTDANAENKYLTVTFE